MESWARRVVGSREKNIVTRKIDIYAFIAWGAWWGKLHVLKVSRIMPSKNAQRLLTAAAWKTTSKCMGTQTT